MQYVQRVNTPIAQTSGVIYAIVTVRLVWLMLIYAWLVGRVWRGLKCICWGRFVWKIVLLGCGRRILIILVNNALLDALLVRMLGSTSALPAGLMQGTPTTSIWMTPSARRPVPTAPSLLPAFPISASPAAPPALLAKAQLKTALRWPVRRTTFSWTTAACGHARTPTTRTLPSADASSARSAAKPATAPASPNAPNATPTALNSFTCRSKSMSALRSVRAANSQMLWRWHASPATLPVRLALLWRFARAARASTVELTFWVERSAQSPAHRFSSAKQSALYAPTATKAAKPASARTSISVSTVRQAEPVLKIISSSTIQQSAT